MRTHLARTLLAGAVGLPGALVAGGSAAPAAAQDVEMLGRRYGTRPPAAYYRAIARDPGAFRFQHGRALRMRVEARERALRRGGPGPEAGPSGAGGGGGGRTDGRGVRAPSLSLIPTPGAGGGGSASGAGAAATSGIGPRVVHGDFHLPVLLGLFEDTPREPFDSAQVEAAYFADAPGTVRRYYQEVSRDSVRLLGELRDWVQSGLTQAQVTAGVSGLEGSRIGDFITELLELQSGVPWGDYDNDGPDGIPNSDDDDGFVDALAVIHPTVGAECSDSGDRPNRIWSHKWTLEGTGAGAFDTGVTSTAHGTIKVDDYFIQGAFSCEGAWLNEIGVFTHETGHAFGLPDLYDTRSAYEHAGAGTWDLMSSGSWGCDDRAPSSPCHMGAWSKAMLGWVEVTTLPADTDLGTLTLPPVETSGTVYRIDAADGSGEYFLLENRQSLPSGFDQNLYEEGLLVWHIDPAAVEARWPTNTVNGADRMAVWLRQADGRDDLGLMDRPRGDPGDPFPFEGSIENREFHAASDPASTSRLGTATGLTVLNIARMGDDVELDVLTRFITVSVRADGQEGTAGLFTVDGAPVDPVASGYASAPFTEHLVEASPAEDVGPGERIPFVEWADDVELPRSRVIVTPTTDVEYVARYAGREYQLTVALTGGVDDVVPGTVESTPASPDLWFADSTDVTVVATPRTGFDFRAWTGALADQPNPATVTMTGPVSAGADFELVYAVATMDVSFPAATPQNVQLEIESGTAPVRWRLLSGELPTGLALSESGRITGAAIEMGAFPLELEATDAIGLAATGRVTLDVLAPAIPIDRLTSFFLLSGVEMQPVEMAFLDRQANRDGGYDLGDFRAWVLANPSLPLSASVVGVAAETSAPRRVVVPVRPLTGSEER